MKKIINLIFLFVCIFCSISCEEDKNDNKTPYTVKEQLDYINDNLYFMDDYIKLGKSIPQIQEREENEDNHIDNYDRQGFENPNYKLYYFKSKTYDYGYIVKYPPVSEFSHDPYSLTEILFDGDSKLVTEQEFVVVKLFTKIDNISLFGDRMFGDGENIKKNLLERGFSEIITYKTSIYCYGPINISFKKFGDKIGYICLYLSPRIMKESFEKYFPNIEFTKENIIKYFYPFECKNDIWLISINETNLGIGEEKYTNGFLVKKGYLPKDVKDLLEQLKSDDFEDKVQSRIFRSYYASYGFDNKIEDLDKLFDEKYLSTLDNLTIKQFTPKYGTYSYKDLEENNNICEKYLYLLDLIKEMPGYDDYIASQNAQ